MLPLTSRTLILFPILLLSLLLCRPPSFPAAPIGLDAFLADQLRLDPNSINDTFLSLPSAVRRSLSSTPPPPLHSLIDYLRSGISVPVPVYVRLVGRSFSSAAPSILSSLASAAYSSGPFQVVGPGPSHHLAASHSIHLEAAHAPNSLAARISDAVRHHIESSPAPFLRTALHSVPVSVVDDIVREDYRKESEHAPSGYYVYLLDLGSQAKPYAYSYESKDPSSSSSSPAFSRCLGSLWTGTDRYVWIDLAAGPVDYGPALSGDGVLPKGEFHPLATIHGRPKSERTLLADLASLVLSAYRALLVPSLRIPVFFETSLLVRFVHIHGSQVESTGLDLGAIEKTIQDSGLLLRGQTLRFESSKVKYSECAICSFAIAKSTYSYTSRFLFDNYTLIVSEYLDSKRLHQVLTDSFEEIHRAAGIFDEEVGRVVPVYVFDLDYDRLLMLDRYHQSVAFRNMVIAVRTRSSQTVSDYSCNGRHVITQTRDLERPIMGSLLQSMWGVTPTHLSWSPQHNSTLVDYTWSVGQTPFGPFSESYSLSFVQKDAARRNMLLTSLNYTITSAIDVLTSMAAHGGDKKLLKDKHTEFLQRWNLLKYKIDKAVSAMSHFDFEKASYFVRSSDHDLYAIHTLAYQASQELEASLICFQDPPFPWATASVSVGIVIAFVYVYLRRDKLFSNKRKRF